VEDALESVKLGQNLYIQGGAATPDFLLNSLCNRVKQMKPEPNNQIRLHHIHLEGKAPIYEPDFEPYFRGNTMFIGSIARNAVQNGRADFIPIFLSEIPILYRTGKIPIDVAFIHVSPPDHHGYCSLGVSVCEARSAVEMADVVIAQVNPQMPRTFGDGYIHISEIDYAVEVDVPLPEAKEFVLSERELQIGRNVAELIENGSCLQMGIGNIPNACLKALKDHRDLGFHTEMFSDGILELVDNGCVTGMQKEIVPGKMVASFAVGTRKLYDFIGDR